MKKNDSFVAENVANKEHAIILNGTRMERDEHGDYKKVGKPSKWSASLSIAAFCSIIAGGLLLIASIFSNQVNSNLEMPSKAHITENGSWGSDVRHTESSIEANAHEETSAKTKRGDSYSVVSPTLSGYTADQSTTSGVMSDGDQTRNVNYDKR